MQVDVLLAEAWVVFLEHHLSEETLSYHPINQDSIQYVPIVEWRMTNNASENSALALDSLEAEARVDLSDFPIPDVILHVLIAYK